METFVFNENLLVYCLRASSFPAGVAAVYDQLHQLFPPGDGRTYFGISFPAADGAITYLAAVSLNQTDSPPGAPFETFEIKKGRYKSKVIRNFMSDLPEVGKTFRNMISGSDIDPNGYCLEMYLNPTDVRCMVRLAD